MRCLLGAVLLLAVGGSVAHAAEPPPGATTCSGCHAPAGGSGFLPIDGRDAPGLASAMEAFKTGARSSTVMGRLMKGFSHEDIQAIAMWISAQ